MHYSIPPSHSSISTLVEIAEDYIDRRNPMGAHKSQDLVQTFFGSIPGAPNAAIFNVLAIDAEDRDIHLFLQRREDGQLAYASYVEGDDIGDDEFTFSYLNKENHAAIMGRLERWSEFNLEEDQEYAYQSLISCVTQKKEKKEDVLAADILLLAPVLAQLEGVNNHIRTTALKEAITKALIDIQAATR